MSSRALRRLQKEQLASVDQNNSDEDSDAYEPPSKAQNLFDLVSRTTKGKQCVVVTKSLFFFLAD